MKRKFTLSSDIPKGNNNKDNLIQKDKDNIKNLIEADDNCGCGCSCSSELTQLPSSSIEILENSFEKQQMQKERERKEDKQAKILILIGLTLTIPLVILELLEFYNIVEDSLLVGFIFLFLATPIQSRLPQLLLLGLKNHSKRLDYLCFEISRCFSTTLIILLSQKSI